jgi:uncharacterized membrane protein
MRAGFLAIGLILLVIGILIVLSARYPNPLVGSYGGYSLVVYNNTNVALEGIGSILGIIGFVLTIAGLSSHKPKPKEKNKILKELKMRYAKGKITRKKYTQMKKDLK